MFQLLGRMSDSGAGEEMHEYKNVCQNYIQLPRAGEKRPGKKQSPATSALHHPWRRWICDNRVQRLQKIATKPKSAAQHPNRYVMNLHGVANHHGRNIGVGTNQTNCDTSGD